MWGRIGTGVFVVLLWGTGAAVGDRAPGPRGAPGVPGASDALDKPAFTATPAELLAAGKVAPPGDWPAVVLREQTDTSYDELGRATVRERWVYVVRTQVGIDGWGTVRAAWRPFYQDKPVLRARVIDPAGNVAELDPALSQAGLRSQLHHGVMIDVEDFRRNPGHSQGSEQSFALEWMPSKLDPAHVRHLVTEQ